MMGPGYGYMPEYMGWTMFGSFLFWALLVGLAVYAIIRFTRLATKGTDAKAILDERVARGDIDPEEYRARLAVLGSR